MFPGLQSPTTTSFGGDVALIDDDGFIKITSRISRFSKIGGEMVPHVRVEEELAQILCEGDDDEEVRLKGSCALERRLDVVEEVSKEEKNYLSS